MNAYIGLCSICYGKVLASGICESCGASINLPILPMTLPYYSPFHPKPVECPPYYYYPPIYCSGDTSPMC